MCGGRLHGLCGEVEDPGSDEPMHRIYQTCATAKATTTGSSSAGMSTSAGKRKVDDTRGWGAEVETMPPPSYAELSSFLGPLEHFAPSYGNGKAGNLLRKAKMSFIKETFALKQRDRQT